MKQVSDNKWMKKSIFKISAFIFIAFFILISINNNTVVLADVYGNAPKLVNAATDHLGKTITLEFDQSMNDPSDKEEQFDVKMAGYSIPIKSTAIGTDDNEILLILDNKVMYATSPAAVTVSYTEGDVSNYVGTSLESFTDVSVYNQVVPLELVDYEPDAVEVSCEENGEGGYTVTYELRNLMDYDNVNLAIYFDHGFFRNLADNLSYPYVQFYNKDTGEEVELPNILTEPVPFSGSLPDRYMEYTDWYFYQIQAHAPLGLSLKSCALEPNTTYVVEVLKGFSFHTGPINNTYKFEFTTTSDSEYKPYWEDGSSLSATNITNTSVNLEWPEACDNHGAAYNHPDSGQYIPNLKYNIYKNGELLTTVDEKTTTYNVTNLELGTEYIFTVEAEDFAGNKSIATLETEAATTKSTVLKHAYTNKLGTEVILAFNKSMEDPTGKEDKFHLSIDGNERQIDLAKLGTDQQMIILQPKVSVTTGQIVTVTTGQAVTVSYESNDLEATDQTCVEPFTNFVVNNLTGIAAATGNTVIDETWINKDVLITEDTPSSINVTVPKEVSDAVLNVESLMKYNKGIFSTKQLPAINIQSDTELDINPVIINIPQDTIVSSEDTWNGEILLPTVKENNSVSITPDSGKTATVRSVIEIGSENESLEFDKAVRILIPGAAGKDVGFVRKGVFTKITNVLEQDSQEIGDALVAGGDGKIDVGNDLVIWTKHFTTFVTYTQVAISEDNDDDNPSGGTQEDDPGDGEIGDGTGQTPGAGANLRDSIISDFKPSATLISSTDDTEKYRFNKLVDYRNVEFVWYFTYGFFATFEDNIANCIKFYNKETGEEVNLPNKVTVPITVDNYYMEVTDWWFERISGHCPLGLTLVSKELEPNTTYVIEILEGWEFNNGNKTSVSYSFEFTTTASASDTTPLVTQGYQVDSTSGIFGEAGAKVEIPENAFTGQFSLAIKRVASTAGFTVPQGSKLVGDVVEITKDVEGEFLKPVTISLPFNPDEINLEDYDLEIYWWNEETGNWIVLDNIKVDKENKCVTGEVNHFTKFAVLAKMKYYPGDIIGHWAETVLDPIIQKGIMKGYPDHMFKPDKGMTRAEFVTVLVKALDLTGEDNIVFGDCKTHWAKKEISIASSVGIIKGNGNDVFNPDNPITREEIAVILSRALELDAAKTLKAFSDQSEISLWAIDAIDKVCEKGYMVGYPGNTFRPKANITRAEVAVIINNLLSKK